MIFFYVMNIQITKYIVTSRKSSFLTYLHNWKVYIFKIFKLKRCLTNYFSLAVLDKLLFSCGIFFKHESEIRIINHEIICHGNLFFFILFKPIHYPLFFSMHIKSLNISSHLKSNHSWVIYRTEILNFNLLFNEIFLFRCIW